jgi:hypothetical protein
MSEFTRGGIQQTTSEKAKESKPSTLQTENTRLDATPYGLQETRFNENEKKAQVTKRIDEDAEEPETLTRKDNDDLDKQDDLEEAHLMNNAKEISGLRIFDKDDKFEVRRLYNEDKKFISVSAMGKAINYGSGIYRGGFNRFRFVNGNIGDKAPKNKPSQNNKI